MYLSSNEEKKDEEKQNEQLQVTQPEQLQKTQPEKLPSIVDFGDPMMKGPKTKASSIVFQSKDHKTLEACLKKYADWCYVASENITGTKTLLGMATSNKFKKWTELFKLGMPKPYKWTEDDNNEENIMIRILPFNKRNDAFAHCDSKDKVFEFGDPPKLWPKEGAAPQQIKNARTGQKSQKHDKPKLGQGPRRPWKDEDLLLGFLDNDGPLGAAPNNPNQENLNDFSNVSSPHLDYQISDEQNHTKEGAAPQKNKNEDFILGPIGIDELLGRVPNNSNQENFNDPLNVSSPHLDYQISDEQNDVNKRGLIPKHDEIGQGITNSDEGLITLGVAILDEKVTDSANKVKSSENQRPPLEPFKESLPQIQPEHQIAIQRREQLLAASVEKNSNAADIQTGKFEKIREEICTRIQLLENNMKVLQGQMAQQQEKARKEPERTETEPKEEKKQQQGELIDNLEEQIKKGQKRPPLEPFKESLPQIQPEHQIAIQLREELLAAIVEKNNNMADIQTGKFEKIREEFSTKIQLLENDIILLHQQMAKQQENQDKARKEQESTETELKEEKKQQRELIDNLKEQIEKDQKELTTAKIERDQMFNKIYQLQQEALLRDSEKKKEHDLMLNAIRKLQQEDSEKKKEHDLMFNAIRKLQQENSEKKEEHDLMLNAICELQQKELLRESEKKAMSSVKARATYSNRSQGTCWGCGGGPGHPWSFNCRGYY